MNSLESHPRVYDFGAEIEASLKERFEQFDKTAEYNQLKGTDGHAEKQSKCRMFPVIIRLRL